VDDKIPSKSFLPLDDWKSNPLTMASLRDNWSALESSAPVPCLPVCLLDRRDPSLPLLDECIHLVTGVQLARVQPRHRHAVGGLGLALRSGREEVLQGPVTG
jgi:hypothetical protein